jgi:hypothetical protein
MRSAYVIKIELNTKLIFTDLEDNRVSINGLDNQDDTVVQLSHVVCATLKNKKIQSAHHLINLQREEIYKQSTIIQTLQDKLDKSRGKA